MEELGLVIAETISQELEDKRKATHNHLPCIGGLLSQELAINDDKRVGLELHANNIFSESYFFDAQKYLLFNVGVLPRT